MNIIGFNLPKARECRFEHVPQHESRRCAFPDKVSDGLFLPTPALTLCLDLMRIYIQKGDLPLILSGDKGSGKTTLMQQLVTRSEARWRMVRVPAIPTLTRDELAALLSEELNLTRSNSATRMLFALDDWLERGECRGELVVLVVDDAHRLRDDVLAWLHALPTRFARKRLRVVFTGEPGFDRRVGAIVRPEYPVKTAHVVTVPTFGTREVARYLEGRLAHAGRENVDSVSSCLIETIARESGGRPGRINELARELEIEAMKAGRWRVVLFGLRSRARRWMMVVPFVLAAAALTLDAADGPGFAVAMWAAPATLAPGVPATVHAPRARPATLRAAHPGADKTPARSEARGRAREAGHAKHPATSCGAGASTNQLCPRDPRKALALLLFSQSLLPRVWANGR